MFQVLDPELALLGEHFVVYLSPFWHMSVLRLALDHDYVIHILLLIIQ